MQKENNVMRFDHLRFLTTLGFLLIFILLIPIIACTKPGTNPTKTDLTYTLPEPEIQKKEAVKFITDQRFLPKDKYGLVDWREVINRGLINPASSLDTDEPADSQEKTTDFVVVWSSTIKPSLSFSPIVKTIPLGGSVYQYDEGIDFQRMLERITFSKDSPLGKRNPKGIEFILKPKVGFMADAYFPHNIHTYWLDCKNCHPEIFPINNTQLVRISMTEIFKGKFCGRCHGKVAFPVTDCGRCHLEHLN